MNVLIDYAAPMMATETAIKKAHDFMLANDYDSAIEAMLDAIADAKLTLHAINHTKELKEVHRALCEQAKTV
jgi:hypothetical protein